MNVGNLILMSKAVFTGLADKPEKCAVVISGNQIKAVIPQEKMESYRIEGTKVYDFGDKMIMPGFIDAHMHYFMGAVVASKYMCRELTESKSEEEAAEMIKKFAEANPNEPRIRGMGWFPANWNDAPLPTCKSLDAAVPDRPVYLFCADGHTFWVNSKALEEVGFTKETKVVAGEIGKFPDGTLNGLVFEPEAYAPLMDKMMEMTKEQKTYCQKEFVRMLNECGITGVSDMSAMIPSKETEETLSLARDMEERDELTVRLHVYPALGMESNDEMVLALEKKFCSDKLKISGVKGFVDGVTSTYTGYLLEPYEDRPETRSSSIFSEEMYNKCITQANGDGIGVRLHAVGDGAVRLALDAFEISNKKNNNPGNVRKLRNSIEHIEDIHPEDIPRFKKLGVTASVQPYHLTLDQNEKIQRIGKSRCEFEWPHRKLLDQGAMLAFGADYPVVDFNPFLEIYAAVTRCDEAGNPTGINPDEKITMAEAIKAYTLGSAYVYGREKELGTLESGKFADLVVLDKNLFDLDGDEILSCKVEMTIMDGKIVYEKI